MGFDSLLARRGLGRAYNVDFAPQKYTAHDCTILHVDAAAVMLVGQVIIRLLIGL